MRETRKRPREAESDDSEDSDCDGNSNTDTECGENACSSKQTARTKHTVKTTRQIMVKQVHTAQDIDAIEDEMRAFLRCDFSDCSVLCSSQYVLFRQTILLALARPAAEPLPHEHGQQRRTATVIVSPTVRLYADLDTMIVCMNETLVQSL
jgi:hypothetical protein